MPEYTVTLQINTSAATPVEAARDFQDFLGCNKHYTVTVAEFDGDYLQDVVQVEL